MIEKIKELRAKTSMPVSACKKALNETDGDVDAAHKKLIASGASVNKNRSDKDAREGFVGVYSHNGNAASFVTLNCETDFVARSAEFVDLANDLAKQIVAMRPKYIDKSDMDPLEEDDYRDSYENQAMDEGKPSHIVGKIIDGKMKKLYSELCLLQQPWIRDDSQKVEDLINELAAKVREKVEVRSFSYTDSQGRIVTASNHNLMNFDVMLDT